MVVMPTRIGPVIRALVTFNQNYQVVEDEARLEPRYGPFVPILRANLNAEFVE
ncbi:hypothetical protein SERLADRAFT_393135 [Serpula lacrymans var. lacrymans S7.9]|uniref:Uncharacterized protein n=1 Tax=Serpula lacrymans var. lacrymans (strain S7.9) TaxID=578457 RepID=F8P0D6_SERL9|nr:uncharacterized protein SERLADRAFT_393135 [Serpula lacrymans var. lacrymans S7.9]EGO24149.1 hypothetical protein SERLADRAFT_393135 [Serpula lacrymans var. lacrymans S7.9]